MYVKIINIIIKLKLKIVVEIPKILKTINYIE